jgi:hypothetical protein
MPPESSRLQGQTSTVLFLSLSHALIPLVHVPRADTESVPACVKTFVFNALIAFWQGFHIATGDPERPISRQAVSV